MTDNMTPEEIEKKIKELVALKYKTKMDSLKQALETVEESSNEVRLGLTVHLTEHLRKSPPFIEFDVNVEFDSFEQDGTFKVPKKTIKDIAEHIQQELQYLMWLFPITNVGKKHKKKCESIYEY